MHCRKNSWRMEKSKKNINQQPKKSPTPGWCTTSPSKVSLLEIQQEEKKQPNIPQTIYTRKMEIHII